MPDVKVCRGCAGTGIGHHVPPRVVQILTAGRSHSGIKLDPPDPEGATPRMRPRYLRIVSITESGEDGQRTQGTFRGPLAHVLAELEGLQQRGFTISRDWPMEPEKDWRCEWCHGTGKPALSVQTLEIGARNG